MNILICTDGSKGSIQSAALITEFGFPTTTRVVVLGVSGNTADLQALTTAIDLIEKRLNDKYLLSKKMRYGDPIEEILSEAVEGAYDLVVVGGGGVQLGLLRPQIGSTTSKLARILHTHFLVGRNIPTHFENILICIGDETPASETISLGGEWISKTSALIGLLHVVPINKKTSLIKNNLKPMYDLLIDQAMAKLRDASVKNEIVIRIRHGLVVEEVLKELKKGGYELLVIGSHYQRGQDRWQETLLDDITDQLLNQSTCSVLII